MIAIQVDFAKAFDSVDHDTLWCVLESYGLHGRILDALKRSYAKVLMRVKANGKLGPEFSVGRGVKQGCPLSVTLFCLFIEILAHYIDAHDADRDTHFADGRDWRKLRGQRPLLGGLPTSNLLFVDDASLLATGRERAECLLKLLSEFCDATGMCVNNTKCEVLIFGGTAQERRELVEGGFLLNSVRLRVIDPPDTARYLGLHYGPGRRFTQCTTELLTAGRKATYALHSLCRERRISVPYLRMQLYNALVVPVYSFGAQVWAADRLGVAFETAMKDPMVEEQRRYMRSVVGARCPPMACLYRELSQYPLHLHWGKLVLRFWNSLVGKQGSLCHRAFCADLELALHGCASCWSHHVINFLSSAGLASPPNMGIEEQVAYYSSLRLPIGDLTQLLVDKLDSKWTGDEVACVDPRCFPLNASGVKSCRYANWMGLPFKAGDQVQWLAHTKTVMPAAKHQLLMRFRLGCWELEVNRPNGRTRAERTCRVCGDNAAVEDELHVLCECPCYERLRLQYEGSIRFSEVGTRGMRAIMLESPPSELASFLHDVWTARRIMLKRHSAKERLVEGD